MLINDRDFQVYEVEEIFLVVMSWGDSINGRSGDCFAVVINGYTRRIGSLENRISRP